MDRGSARKIVVGDFYFLYYIYYIYFFLLRELKGAVQMVQNQRIQSSPKKRCYSLDILSFYDENVIRSARNAFGTVIHRKCIWTGVLGGPGHSGPPAVQAVQAVQLGPSTVNGKT